MTTFFTSDLHLGHENVLRFANRPWQTVEEMNRALIASINAMVGMNDELWVLGDFSYRLPKKEAGELARKIACRHVHLVVGNHDKDWAGEGVFESVQHCAKLKTEYGKVILFHYPMLDWDGRLHGPIHLHGHIHSTGDYNIRNVLRENREWYPEGHVRPESGMLLRMWDVGVDANGYAPVSLDEIAAMMGIREAG